MASGNAGHHQPALRLDDGKVGDSAAISEPGSNFRLDKRGGRVVWDAGGASYAKYFLPANLLGGEMTPESLDCEMHHAGVDAALLHTNDMLVRDPAYLAEICRRYPRRFRAMAPTREDLIVSDPAAAVDHITQGPRPRPHPPRPAPPPARAGVVAASTLGGAGRQRWAWGCTRSSFT